MSGIFKGFKDFIARGNAIEMAVGIVIGAAFSDVINTVVNAIINPIIGMFMGSTSLADAWYITLPTLPWGEESAAISVGGVADALLTFLLIAVAVYFFIVLPMNKLAERRAARIGAPDAPAEVPADEALLAEIRDLLKEQNSKG